MSRSTVRIVPRSTEAGDDSLGTAGLARFEAFDDEGRWVGYTTTVPGVMEPARMAAMVSASDSKTRAWPRN